MPVTRNSRTSLLVDASSTMLYYHGILLRRFEYEVVTASSAEDALDAAGRSVPSIVITEAALPRMSGVELIKKLKAAERTREVPVIVLSGETDSSLQEDCRDAGACAFLVKPVDPELLYRTVQSASERLPREHIRLETCLKVIVGDGSALGGAERTEYATAISEGGLYVRTLYPQPKNAVTPLRISVGDREIRAKAVVLYTCQLEGGAFREPGMGMKFVGISAADRAFLREFIRRQLTGDIRASGPGGG